MEYRCLYRTEPRKSDNKQQTPFHSPSFLHQINKLSRGDCFALINGKWRWMSFGAVALYMRGDRCVAKIYLPSPFPCQYKGVMNVPWYHCHARLIHYKWQRWLMTTAVGIHLTCLVLWIVGSKSKVARSNFLHGNIVLSLRTNLNKQQQHFLIGNQRVITHLHNVDENKIVIELTTVYHTRTIDRLA